MMNVGILHFYLYKRQFHQKEKVTGTLLTSALLNSRYEEMSFVNRTSFSGEFLNSSGVLQQGG